MSFETATRNDERTDNFPQPRCSIPGKSVPNTSLSGPTKDVIAVRVDWWELNAVS